MRLRYRRLPEWREAALSNRRTPQRRGAARRLRQHNGIKFRTRLCDVSRSRHEPPPSQEPKGSGNVGRGAWDPKQPHRRAWDPKDPAHLQCAMGPNNNSRSLGGFFEVGVTGQPCSNETRNGTRSVVRPSSPASPGGWTLIANRGAIAFVPAYPPPRRLRTDNIKRVLSRSTAEPLWAALSTLRGKSGMWPENDPEAYAAYLQDLLNDPRLQRTRAEHIPSNHPDASLRLDRCLATHVMVSCENCKASAIYTVGDLRASFGDDQSITALPTYLVPCQSKRERREGACRLRSEPSGHTDNVRSVAQARKAVS